MKHILLALLLVFSGCLSVCAQTNPQPGFIIANDGDTIVGTIDYLSAAKNARACMFRREGEVEFRTYHPGDIQAYRLSDTGVFYVSRTLKVDGVAQTVFAEYLLKGGVSLYRYSRDGEVRYYMVDADGEEAEINFDEEHSIPGEKRLEQKRKAIMQASQLLRRSPDAVERLWRDRITAENLTALTREYDENYCQEQGDCVQFEYDRKATASVKAHLRLQAGWTFARFMVEDTSPLFKTWGTCPEVGVGCDMMFPRLSKHLSAQFMLLLSYLNTTEDYTVKGWLNRGRLTAYTLTAQLGAKYNFAPEGKVSPYLRAGYMPGDVLSAKHEYMYEYWPDADVYRSFKGDKSSPQLGFYVGGGVDWKTGVHRFSLSANYMQRASTCYVAKGVVVMLGYVF